MTWQRQGSLESSEQDADQSGDKPIPDKAGDEVGFGKPPKRTQFKKGQSGNPKGRPKKKSTPRDNFDEIFNKPLRVKIDGRPRNITAAQAILLQIRARCMKGDLMATRLFFQHCRDMNFMSPPAENGKLDELLEALRQGPVPPGEFNE